MDNSFHFDSAKPSLLWLSDDALLQMFKYLKQNDALSLAATCRRLQKLSYRNFNSVEIYPEFCEKDDLHIVNLIDIIGRHIRDLTIAFNQRHIWEQLSSMRLKHLFEAISKNCKSLEVLKIFNFRVYKKRFSPNYHLTDFINVRSLSFYKCDLTYGKKLFRMLRKVESLQVENELCDTSDIDFGKFFRKNKEIKKFVWNGHSFLKRFEDTKVFEVLPKLEQLCINIEKISSLNPLTKLERLKDLQITLKKEKNINKFLNRLVLKVELEKLRFGKIEVNEATVEALQNFHRLIDLTLHCSRNMLFRINSNTPWPQNLQSLRLIEADIDCEGFFSVIRKLRSLKRFHLTTCHVNEADKPILYDTTQINRKILEAMDSSTNSGKLEVTLLDLNSKFYISDHFCFDYVYDQKVVVESNRLSIQIYSSSARTLD